MSPGSVMAYLPPTTAARRANVSAEGLTGIETTSLGRGSRRRGAHEPVIDGLAEAVSWNGRYRNDLGSGCIEFVQQPEEVGGGLGEIALWRQIESRIGR